VIESFIRKKNKIHGVQAKKKEIRGKKKSGVAKTEHRKSGRGTRNAQKKGKKLL